MEKKTYGKSTEKLAKKWLLWNADEKLVKKYWKTGMKAGRKLIENW